MSVTSNEYLTIIQAVLSKVGTGQETATHKAAEILTETVRNGGVIQAFGCGHSEALELTVRAVDAHRLPEKIPSRKRGRPKGQP